MIFDIDCSNIFKVIHPNEFRSSFTMLRRISDIVNSRPMMNPPALTPYAGSRVQSFTQFPMQELICDIKGSFQKDCEAHNYIATLLKENSAYNSNCNLDFIMVNMINQGIRRRGFHPHCSLLCWRSVSSINLIH